MPTRNIQVLMPFSDSIKYFLLKKYTGKLKKRGREEEREKEVSLLNSFVLGSVLAHAYGHILIILLNVIKAKQNVSSILNSK